MGRTDHSLRSARWSKRTLATVCRFPAKFHAAYLYGLQLLRIGYAWMSAQRRSVCPRGGIHQRKSWLGESQARQRKNFSTRSHPRSSSVHGVKSTSGKDRSESVDI